MDGTAEVIRESVVVWVGSEVHRAMWCLECQTQFRHAHFDSEKNIVRWDYGFMPVKNATKRDPRIHIAYLTTSSEGNSIT